jgi:hypothetical protein
VAVLPVLLGTAYGIWKENQLDKEVWQVIDEMRAIVQDTYGSADRLRRVWTGARVI